MKKYRIIANSNNHGFKIGEIVEGQEARGHAQEAQAHLIVRSKHMIRIIAPSDYEVVNEPQPRYRLFNAATDSLDDLSKLKTRGGEDILWAKRNKYGTIAFVCSHNDEDLNFKYVSHTGQASTHHDNESNDLMISIPAPIEVKQYQNQYKEGIRTMYDSIEEANTNAAHDRLGMSERVLIDGKLVSIRLLSKDEYENV